MRTKTKSFASVALMLVLAIVLISAMSYSLTPGVSFAAADGTITAIDEISVGHMSDIHYFPLSHCYQDVYGPTYKDSEFYHSTTGDTKLVLESGMVLNATIKQIIADGIAKKAPQYLIASGDLSKNGERVALIDVANSLRYLQNEMRKLEGYENFQVFATVGNHDLYNHNGALYSQEDGKSRPADMITAMQFAMIFAGLGFPEVSLDTAEEGRLTLTDYLPAEYWYSNYTSGYVASDNAQNLEIAYYSPALAQIANKKTSSEILDCYFNVGDGLNQLTYFASLTDKTGYSFAIIDSSDREETDSGALVRISQKEFDKMPASSQPKTVYLDNGNSNVEIDLANPQNPGEAFNQTEKAVYRRTPVQHITGGRITTECLDWVEIQCNKQNTANMEETIISSFHHNVLPHFEQEDDILKDFTLYNWEYTAKRFLDMGIRYSLTGHMHASDAMYYTDVEGRTLYDFETGSTISYSSPRRYLTFERNNCDGKLGEQLTSEVHVLGNIKEIASDNIANAPVWNDASYQAAIANYKSIPETNVEERAQAWQNVVKTNPDYLTYIIRYDEFAKLTNPDTMYNDFISQDIYCIIVDRMVDHFINQSTIDGLIEPLHGIILGLKDNAIFTTLKTLFGLKIETVAKAADYMIDTILYDLYGDKGYPDNESKNTLEYVLSIVNGILDLEYGDAAIGTESTNPNKTNVGKLKVRELASFIMMSHSAGNEISFDETYASIDAKFGHNDADYGDNHYRYKQPTNPVFRKRMLAALKDFDKQLKNGEVVKVLIDSILDPLFNNEDSILKTLLNYKFDFRKADISETEFESLEKVFNTLSSPLIIQIINGMLGEGNALPDDIELSFDAKSVSLNEILVAIFPVAKPIIANMLGFNMVGDNIIEVVENFLNDYLTQSFYVGLGGIASNIVTAFATDVYPDLADQLNPATPFAIQPYGEYTYAGEKMSYVSSKNIVSSVNASFNAATQDNGRVPSRVTANFDTINSTTAFTVKFYTAEEVYGTFKYKTSVDEAWTTVSTSKEKADSDADYFDSSNSLTSNGITVEMRTQTKPVYLPLIDLGLLCLTHAEVDYEKEVNGETVDVPYKYGERDNAPKNSIVYWNVTTVTVTGLSPDTTYYYDIEGIYESDTATASFSFVEYNKTLGYDRDYFTFKTAKSADSDKFEFLTIADIQGMIQGMYSDSFNAVKALLANDATKNFDFILNAGDMCDNGKNFNQWAMALNTYQTLFANTSMFFAAGNHESGSNALTNYFNYSMEEGQTTADGAYYSFDYANAHFVVLNTNDADNNGLGQAQLAWLTEDLKNSDSKWKFVLMHKSLYSGGSHSTDSEVVAMRAQLQKLFAETGVTIVFGGHDHTYTSTYLVDQNGNVTDKSNDAEIKSSGDGVLYITLGTMGTKFYTYKPNDDISGNFDEDNSILDTLSSQTFGKVVVEGDVLTYTGYQYDSKTNTIKTIGESTKLKAISKETTGLSLGAKIAIGVVVPVVILAVAAVVIIIVVKKQQEKKRLEALRRKKIAALKRAKLEAMAREAKECGIETDSESTSEQTEQPASEQPSDDVATADNSDSPNQTQT